MQKKMVGALLVLAVLLCMLAFAISASDATAVTDCAHPIADGDSICSSCGAIVIRTAEDLLVLMHSDNVDSSDEGALAAAQETLGKSYVLADDIDLSTYDYTAEGNYTSQSPIGTKNERWDYDVLAFTGIFDGNGKTVSGVNINSSENHVGFFGGTMNGAVIEDLTVEGTIKGGNYTGGIVGWNRDTLTISNCTSKVTVIGGADVGGIVGYAETVSANHSVLLDSCVNEGALSGSGRVGGMIGRLWQNASSGTAKIADCVNNATVTTSGGQAAGMLAWWTASSGTAQSLTIGDCTNTGAATGGNGATAGIFGFGQIQAATALTIENCDNLADDVNDKIQDAAYAGGILARVDKNAPLSLTVSDCTNTMNVSSNHRAAGIVGYHNVPSGSKTEIKMCSNSGAIAGATKVGGIVGELYALYGATTAVTKCMNFGAVTTTGTGDNYAAGIVAYYNAQSNAVSALSECMNSGTITSAAYAAGIIGMRNGGTTVTDAWNSGSVSGTKAGGIIGNSGQAALVSHVFNSNVNVMQAIIGNNATAPNVEDAYYIAGGTVSNSNAGVAYDASIHFDMLNANGKWVEIAGKPELKDLHVHDFVNNTTFKDNGDGTHTVSCACGTPQTGASASLHDYGDSGICACGAFMPIEEITTAKELMILMNASSLWTDGSYTLGNDIDLSAYTGSLRQQPIGNATIAFKGVFDGKGHTISGLELSGVGSIALFGKAENAEIKNLTVEGSITSTKNYAAGIVAEARDRVTISNCTNKATVIGDADVGGIVGYAETGSADHSILIDSCVNEGALRGSGRVGGMIGRLWQNASSGTAKISACVNKATVTTAGGQAAGMLAWWTVSNGTAQSVTIRDCTNTGAATGGNGATAGIFGFGQIQTAAALTIQNCDNLADDVNDKVQDNSYAAGIAGRFDMDAPLSLTASDCTNTMSVSGATISGIVSRILFKTDAAANSVLKFDNCVNTLSDVSGYTSTITATGFSGGILGFIENTKASGFDLDVLNCRNDMEIAGGKQVGGIIASNYIRAAGNSYVYNCTNTGNIKLNTGSEGVGGILGYYYIDSDTVATVEACTNTGKVTGAGHAGGIVGYHNAPAGSTTTFTKCLNSGEITATANAYAAGIVANYFVSSGTASALSECMNSGSISSKGFAGGIIGMRNGTTTVTDVLNTGSVTAVQVSGGIIGHSGETALVSHAFNSSTAVAQAIIGVPATAPNVEDAYHIAASSVSNTNGGVIYDASAHFDTLNANGKWLQVAMPELLLFHNQHNNELGLAWVDLGEAGHAPICPCGDASSIGTTVEHTYGEIGICTVCGNAAFCQHLRTETYIDGTPNCHTDILSWERCADCHAKLTADGEETVIAADAKYHRFAWAVENNTVVCKCAVDGCGVVATDIVAPGTFTELYISEAGQPFGGFSSDVPLNDYDMAMKIAATQDNDVVIYILGRASVPLSAGDGFGYTYLEPAHTNTIKVCGTDGELGVLHFGGANREMVYGLNGPTTFENIEFSFGNAAEFLFLTARHNPLVLGDGITTDTHQVTGSGGKHSGLIYVVGGCYKGYFPVDCSDKSMDVTLCSGTYRTVVGGHYSGKNCGDAGDISLKLLGDVTVRDQICAGNVFVASGKISVTIDGNLSIGSFFTFGSHTAGQRASETVVVLNGGSVAVDSFYTNMETVPTPIGSVDRNHNVLAYTEKLTVYTDENNSSAMAIREAILGSILDAPDLPSDYRNKVVFLFKGADAFCPVARGSHTADGNAPVVTTSTCTVQGYETYHCSACDADYNVSLPLAAHMPGEAVAVAATCVTPEMTRSCCIVCGAVEHSVVGSTFTEHTDPEKTGFCQVCNLNLTANCEHIFGEAVSFASGCGTGTRKTCTLCGKELIDVVSTDHNWGKYVVTLEPLDIAPGVKTRTCKSCGKTETSIIYYESSAINDEVLAVNASGALADFSVDTLKLSKSEKAALSALLQRDAYGSEVKISYEMNGTGVTNITYYIPVPAEYNDYENAKVVVRDDDGNIHFVEFKIEKGYIVFTF